MDEQQQESEIEKSEKQIKQIGKDTARKTGKAMGTLTKKGIKMLIRAIGIKGLAITLAICIVLTLLPVLWYGVTNLVYEAISDIAKSVTEDNSGNIVKITKINGRKYEIDTQELEDKINRWFKTNKVSKEQLGLSNDLSGLSEFLEA